MISRIRPAHLAIATIGLALSYLPASAQSGEGAALLRQHAEAGTLAEGEKLLASRVAANAADAEARAALGFAQFARAIERLGQNLHRHGLRPPSRGGMMLPVLRFPVPANPNPESIDYAKMRGIYAALIEDLAKVEATLAPLPAGEFKLKLNLTSIRLDLDGDGRGSQEESLGGIVMQMVAGPRRSRLGPQQSPADALPPLNIAFDRADAIWLRGYAKFISAFSEFALAHDWQDAFNATAQLFFPIVEGGLNVGALSRPNRQMGGEEGGSIADAIAFLHMLRFDLVEPDRMSRVRQLLLDMIKLSRENWAAIQAETDDEEEWLPSPKQKNVAIGVTDITDDILQAWFATLKQLEDALEGRVLVAHWRFNKGIDLKMVFEEPQRFDFLLWITGQAAVPFLKDGPALSSQTWNEWQRAFRGNFLGIALWFN